VNELAADGIPVAVTCRVLKLARQPYYRWRATPVTDSGVGDRCGVFAGHRCGLAALTSVAGPAGRSLGTDQSVGSCSTGAGVGQRVRGRPVARGQTTADLGDERVPREAGHQGNTMPVEPPSLTAVTLALAAILDDPQHVATQPAAARQLVAILGKLSKRTQRLGKLAAVKSMTTSSSSA